MLSMDERQMTLSGERQWGVLLGKVCTAMSYLRHERNRTALRLPCPKCTMHKSTTRHSR